MTRQDFLTAYRAELLKTYPWAQDSDRLARFMSGVEATLTGPRATWNHDGECVVSAWRAIGGKGKPTLKALRGMP